MADFCRQKVTQGKKLCDKTGAWLPYHLIWGSMLYNATLLDNSERVGQTEGLFPIVRNEQGCNASAQENGPNFFA
jgi:hypothetical protein